ncbi:hypothetical protein B0H14DRAFT_2578483 [Mycena olivaceomarginata]|nr:hypothetical protein B0H14DRAFT_2578483 [Mycena olivaceomarginata]
MGHTSRCIFLADAKPTNGLAKPTKRLASRNVGLGRVFPPESTPKPIQAVWRGFRLGGVKPRYVERELGQGGKQEQRERWDGIRRSVQRVGLGHQEPRKAERASKLTKFVFSAQSRQFQSESMTAEARERDAVAAEEAGSCVSGTIWQNLGGQDDKYPNESWKGKKIIDIPEFTFSHMPPGYPVSGATAMTDAEPPPSHHPPLSLHAQRALQPAPPQPCRLHGPPSSSLPSAGKRPPPPHARGPPMRPAPYLTRLADLALHFGHGGVVPPKFGVTLHGATPANPQSTARMNGSNTGNSSARRMPVAAIGAPPARCVCAECVEGCSQHHVRAKAGCTQAAGKGMAAKKPSVSIKTRACPLSRFVGSLHDASDGPQECIIYQRRMYRTTWQKRDFDQPSGLSDMSLVASGHSVLPAMNMSRVIIALYLPLAQLSRILSAEFLRILNRICSSMMDSVNKQFENG